MPPARAPPLNQGPPMIRVKDEFQGCVLILIGYHVIRPFLCTEGA